MLTPVLLLLSLLAALVPVQAFIGLGIKMYEPSCAYACRTVIGMAMLDCNESPSDDHSQHAMKKRHGHASTVTPECRSTNQPFLSTLAYCISQRCFNDSSISPVPSKSRIEWYFTAESTGDKTVPPTLSYAEALNTVHAAPNATYDPEEMMLESTMLVGVDAWYNERISLETFRDRETQHAKYSVAILVIGFGIPIALFIGQHLPYGTWIRRWLSARYIQPAIFRGHVIQPINRVFLLPTLGQSWYIGLMTALTLLFSFVDTNAVLPNTWFASPSQQTIGYIGNRTGMISMALMPLTILFAGRNNLLLYVTGWSHGTYVILHRWIARLCVLEAILHSILELRLYVLRGTWKETQPELWWIWGSVGTVAGVVMLLASIPRRYYYEIFLITHILLAVFFIVGTWYHVVYLYNFDWGVEYWIYACVAVWFLDRLLRVWRVGKNGLQQVKITLVGEELVRVDMPGIRWSEIPGQHAYVFLPALRKWAPWENHPFSVIPSGLLRAGQSPSTSSYPPSTTSMSAETPSIAGLSCCVSKHDSKDITAAGDHADPEKSLDVAALPVDHKIARTARQRAGEKGITFFIRRRGGLTARLAATDISTPLTALIEGPYRSVHHSPILQVDRLIIIAGGVGITAVLPYVAHHRNITLHWGMRQAQQDLVEHLQPALGLVAANDRQVVLGKRLDIGRIIENEVRDGWSLIGVLVCGPGGMCDDVRKEVVRLGRVTETRLSCKWRHLRGELEIWVHASILQARVSGAWSQETDHQKEARAVYRPVSRL